ncbi:hypothetical protein C5S32_11820 [ANME-1 cluster archaeon GoMg1]|nr:hypothetical protein [ANME-1 cluster archaeon GoMg1]
METRNVILWALLPVIVVLVMSIGVQARELAEVNADDILKQIENGEDIYLENVCIIGLFDFKEPQNIVESEITIINSVFENTVDFSYTQFRKPLDFQDTSFSGVRTIFRGANFSDDANFWGASFNGNADFSDASFGGYANFHDASFSDAAKFWGANFNGNAVFSDASFSGIALFYDASFSDGYADFSDASFSKISWFWNADFNGAAKFRGADFNNVALFHNACFSDDADFSDASFSDDAKFSGASFNGHADFHDASFSDIADFRDVSFDDVAYFVDFEDASFSDDAKFWGASFNGHADFSDASFSGIADFRDVNFRKGVSFDFTEFNRVFFSNTSFTHISLREADFYRMKVDWSSLKNSLVFDGPTYAQLIKNFREMEQFEDADDAYYQYRRLSQANKKWSFSKLGDIFMWVTCGYGVRPQYTIICGVVLILVFALIYRLGNGIMRLKESDGDSIRVSFWDAFYFSMVTFTTVGYGDWYPVDRYRKFVMVEGLVGWLTLALFLVTLANVMIRP